MLYMPSDDQEYHYLRNVLEPMIERSTGSAATAASRTVDAAILLAFAIGYKLYHGAPILTNISNPLPVYIVLAKQL
jgi:hypothetical protein